MSPEGKILIVDDDVELGKLLVVMLNRMNLEAEAVTNGKAALEWLKGQTPDAIVLDRMMSDVDGFTILRQLRAEQPTSQLPIVMLSARSDTAARNESLAAGADAYLTKPATARQLAEELKALLAERKGAQAG